jgi:hypothetical protein
MSSEPVPLLINDKPLDVYVPLGQADNTSSLSLAVLLVLSFTQGLAWGCTVAVAGRLSLKLQSDTEWQQRGTGMSIEAPLIAFVWGIALLFFAPLGGLLVDFRCRIVPAQLFAMLVWLMGAGLLLLPVVLAKAEGDFWIVAMSWLGVGLCAVGAAVLRPLLIVIVADQVREQLHRAQAIGLCFIFFTAGDIVACIIDAAGVSPVALNVTLVCVLATGVAGLLAIRQTIDLEEDLSHLNHTLTHQLWRDFMPSGYEGACLSAYAYTHTHTHTHIHTHTHS